jgi:hypothetical protein
MASVSTWTSPEIDARIVALKQTGLSHAQIAREIVAEFRVFTNKNMVLRRARTILGIDRGERAANDRLERKRRAERTAKEPKAPRPVNVPAPAVTLPPLASALGIDRGECHRLRDLTDGRSFFAPPEALQPTNSGPIDRSKHHTGPEVAGQPLGNGKCAFPLWPNGATPSHEYCSKQTPLGSSWCVECRAVVWHTYRQARAA